MFSMLRFLPSCILAALFVLVSGVPGRGQESPLLMLDTGGHLAIIKAVKFTNSGQYLISASEDKTVRVWDLRDGRTVRTLRGQSGVGKEGRVSAIAVSTDDRWIAVAGWFSGDGAAEPCCGDIRVYELATGKLVRLLKGHTNAVNALAFSPDGLRLLSGSADKSAILWDFATGKYVLALEGRHTGPVSSVAFTSGGALVVTGGEDGLLQFWRAADGRPTIARNHSAAVSAIAISPEADVMASGSVDGEVRIWDRNSGALKRKLTKLSGAIRGLDFVRNGRHLVVSCDCLDNLVRVLDAATGQLTTKYSGHDNVVPAVAMHPNGRLVASAGGVNHEVHLWDLRSGELRQRLSGIGRSVWSVGVSRDAQQIAWGNVDACPKLVSCPSTLGKLQWTLKLPTKGRSLGTPQPAGAEGGTSFVRARNKFGNWTLVHRDDASTKSRDAILEVRENGRAKAAIKRDATSGFLHSAYTFAPDGELIASGGAAGALTLYDRQGQDLADFVGHTNQIWALAISEDGRLLVSGSLDQTLRLWNIESQELIATLFHGSDGDWIMWTPQGYYMSSPGGDRIVGWQINKGVDKEAEYVGADQLGQHLNRPDIVERAIILGSAKEAVRTAAQKRLQLTDLLVRSVPSFRVSPQTHWRAGLGRAEITIAIEATPDPVKSIQLHVNGRLVEEQIPPVRSGGFQAGQRTLDVPLARGHNHVRITLVNDIGEKADTLALTHQGDGALDQRGQLYIVAVGVNEYPGLGNQCGPSGNGSCDLRFAGADARAMVTAIEKHLGPSHTGVVKRLLLNDSDSKAAPTAANILDAMDLFRQAREVDTAVLFVAGHGVNDGPHYRLLATNSEWGEGGLRGSTVVSWHALQEAIQAARGRRIMFVDTCHSGNAYHQRLGNAYHQGLGSAAYRANIIAYAATRFDQEALEDPKLGHGLFTFAVVEGLDGRGDVTGKRHISTKDLARYVVRRVGELAKALSSEQEPQYFKGRDAEDFVLTQR